MHDQRVHLREQDSKVALSNFEEGSLQRAPSELRSERRAEHLGLQPAHVEHRERVPTLLDHLERHPQHRASTDGH